MWLFHFFLRQVRPAKSVPSIQQLARSRRPGFLAAPRVLVVGYRCVADRSRRIRYAFRLPQILVDIDRSALRTGNEEKQKLTHLRLSLFHGLTLQLFFRSNMLSQIPGPGARPCGVLQHKK
jgi:hypothetical protein